MKTLLVTLLAIALSLGCGKKDAEKSAGDGKAEPAAKDPANTADTDKAPPVEPKLVSAKAELKPTKDSKVSGSVVLSQTADGKVSVEAQVTGLTPGDHGFHIHEKGDCSSPDGKSAGGHFNPKAVDHGGPTADAHHAGDLGNLTADDKGVAKHKSVIDFVTLDESDTTALGKAFIVHAKADDMKTQPTGAAGARLACGVIEKR